MFVLHFAVVVTFYTQYFIAATTCARLISSDSSYYISFQLLYSANPFSHGQSEIFIG